MFVLPKTVGQICLQRISSCARLWKPDRCAVCVLHSLDFSTLTSSRRFFCRGLSSQATISIEDSVRKFLDFDSNGRRTWAMASSSRRSFSTSSEMNAGWFSEGQRAWIWEKFQPLKEKMSIFGEKKHSLKRSALIMYGCCTDPLNHLNFFEVLGLPDTFNSWHKITELHVWMCIVRLSNEMTNGKYVRNQIVQAFWKDVDERSQRLGAAAAINRKKGVGELADQFRAAMFGYDEGLLRDDKVLAAAIWRHFFGMQCDDPRKLELLVHYVRKQIENLETQDRHQIFHQGIVKWLPLSEIRD